MTFCELPIIQCINNIQQSIQIENLFKPSKSFYSLSAEDTRADLGTGSSAEGTGTNAEGTGTSAEGTGSNAEDTSADNSILINKTLYKYLNMIKQVRHLILVL